MTQNIYENITDIINKKDRNNNCRILSISFHDEYGVYDNNIRCPYCSYYFYHDF